MTDRNPPRCHGPVATQAIIREQLLQGNWESDDQNIGCPLCPFNAHKSVPFDVKQTVEKARCIEHPKESQVHR
jgi:hypothetical protein